MKERVREKYLHESNVLGKLEKKKGRKKTQIKTKENSKRKTMNKY